MAVRKELVQRFQINNGPPLVWTFLGDKKVSADVAPSSSASTTAPFLMRDSTSVEQRSSWTESIDVFGGMLRWKGGSAMNSSSNPFSTVDKTQGSFVNRAHASTKWAVRPATGKSILETREGLTYRPKMKLLSLRGSCWGGGERLDFLGVEEADGPAKELFTREAVLTWEMSSLTNRHQ